MNMAFDGAILWCAAQALVLASAGLLGAWILAQRAPASAATAAVAAATTIVLLTLLAPVQFPAIELGKSAVGNRPANDSPAAVAPGAQTAAAANSAAAYEHYTASAKAALLRFAALARSAEPGTTADFSTRSLILGVMLASAIIGLARFALALATVTKLRRGRRPIADESLHRLFAELQTRLKIERPIELCESPAVASPALIGWRRPVVLLPVDRADWTDDHFRARLAHELAHIARGDFFWRAVARLAVAIHFCQPLVHWLARRLALLQEAATDRLAAQAVGGAGPYLRSLSELAIRLDDHARFRAEPLVLPAISSHLARRIVMLRSKDGSSHAQRRRIGGNLSAALIALIGAGTMALRSAAEPAAATPTASAGQAFDAPQVDWSFMGPADGGLLVFRPGRMTERESLAPITQFIQGAMDSAAAETEPPAAWQPRLEMIDYYAVRMNIPAQLFNAEGTVDPEAAEQGATITGDLAVRFNDEKAADKFWAQLSVTPSAEIVEVDGFTYAKSAVEAVGFMYAAKRDPLTYVMADNVDRLRMMVEHPASAPGAEPAAPWKSLDRGLVAAYGGKHSATFGFQILMSVTSIEPFFEEPLSVAMTAIHNDMHSLGFGVDVDPQTNELKLRLKAQCNDAAAAERVKASFGVLQAFAREEFEGLAKHAADAEELKTLDELSRAEFDAHLCWTRLVAEATIETKPSEGETVELQLNASAPLPPLVSLPIFQPALAPAPPR